MNNKDNNLDETKVFKTIKDDNDTLEIPFIKNQNKTLEDTIIIENDDISEDFDISELSDEGLNNLKKAEDEINKVLEMQNGNNGDSNMKKKKGKFNRLEKFNIFLIISTLLMIFSFIFAGGFWYKLVKDTPELDVKALANQKRSILYDKDGEPFFDLGMYSLEGTSYQDIVYEEMAENIVDAFVAIEDSRFFKHKGFDIPRFTKALLENISAGGFAQGGSTITMQLIKTSHLTAEKKLERKAQEINLSLNLESQLSKDKIFEYYVNKINYGAGNSRGLESAAQYYFNKSASELSISESALLAGVVNRPNAFSPINNLEAAYKRRNTVLDLMAYHGYLDKEEAELAKAVKIENQLSDAKSKEHQTDQNPYIDYVNAVIDEVSDRLGIDIVATPLNVYTFMDRDIQQQVSDIQNGEGYTYPDQYIQSAIAIGDNDTGELIALGAGRDSQVMKGRNRATRMFQQPGSVTKPLLSYALAFEHLGWATSHVVEDRPVNYAGTDKYLSNFDGRYRGEVTLKDALATSFNTPAYLTLLEIESEIGRGAIADYLHDALGFSKVNRDNYNSQYAIGGSTFQISPAELFGAQAVMMNGGFYTKPHTVDYVETADQEIIKDEFNYPKTKVISEETAYLVSVLENYNVTSGIINRMEVLAGKAYPVYAKTGTTDYGDSAVHLGIPEGAGKDQWMMASSRKYTSIVWMGYDKPEAGKETYWTMAKYNANPLGRMNNILLDSIHRNKENPGRVVRPAGISSITHIISTFPYANPIEDIDPKYITTGEINSKYLNLVDLDKDGINLEKVESFKSDIKANKIDKTINFIWSKYPEDGAIKGATYDISSGRIKATGTRLFDPSWIFGEVKYKATIYVDGKELDTIESSENTFSKSYVIDNKAKIKVCGYYGNSKQSGPETCIDLDNPEIKNFIRIPKFNNKNDLDIFISNNDLDPSIVIEGDTTKTDNATIVGQIASVKVNGVDITNKEYTIDEIKKMKFTVSYYELESTDSPTGFRLFKYFWF